jgi:hypothetical protein
MEAAFYIHELYTLSGDYLVLDTSFFFSDCSKDSQSVLLSNFIGKDWNCALLCVSK